MLSVAVHSEYGSNRFTASVGKFLCVFYETKGEIHCGSLRKWFGCCKCDCVGGNVAPYWPD